MTQVLEIGSTNQNQKNSTGLWLVCYAIW